MIHGGILMVALGTLVAPLALHAQARGAEEPSREIHRIRVATEAFHDPEAARRAGYAPPDPPHCVASAAGGMGYHHVNRALLDGHLEVERPEIVVYVPAGEGALELAGVEYVVPYSAWDRDDPPRLLGQTLRRSDELGIWYLHVWAWLENPAGLFADWNPVVACGH